jgi:glycosyltransferase involved in cell wall biosynthesis
LNKVKTLYISYDGMTDPLGQSQVIPYLSGLAKLGYDITLISCEKPDKFALKKNDISLLLTSLEINWVPLKYSKRPPLLSTIWDVFKLRRAAYNLHKKNKFDIVHCRSYISSLVGLWLKQKFGIKFIFDMRGLWADERLDGGLWTLRNPLHKFIYNYFKGQEKLFLKYSDATVSLTEAGKKEMESWEVCKINKTNIYVIPCSADFNLFRKPEAAIINRNKNDLGIPTDAFVLSYLGSVGTWYMLDEMLDLFKALLKKNTKAIFLILTPDDPGLIYKKLAFKEIDKNKVIVQFSSRKEIVERMSVSNLSVFFIKPCYSKISSSPTKLGELLAMEIPVISNSGVGDVNEIIKATGGGIVIDNFDQQNYIKAIHTLEKVQSADSKSIREKARYYYDLQKAINKYAEIYRRVLA